MNVGSNISDEVANERATVMKSGNCSTLIYTSGI